LEEGKHKGAIVKVEERKEPYEYVDVWIESEGARLKAGYPDIVSEKSKLGKLLMRFGVDLKAGQEVDIDKVLVGKTCQFMVVHEEGKDGNTYHNVLGNTVKPLSEDKQAKMKGSDDAAD
jgi:hypothetical protein